MWTKCLFLCPTRKKKKSIPATLWPALAHKFNLVSVRRWTFLQPYLDMRETYADSNKSDEMSCVQRSLNWSLRLPDMDQDVRLEMTSCAFSFILCGENMKRGVKAPELNIFVWIFTWCQRSQVQEAWAAWRTSTSTLQWLWNMIMRWRTALWSKDTFVGHFLKIKASRGSTIFLLMHISMLSETIFLRTKATFFFFTWMLEVM